MKRPKDEIYFVYKKGPQLVLFLTGLSYRQEKIQLFKQDVKDSLALIF